MSEQIEKKQEPTPPQKKKKRRLKLFIWLGADLIILVVVLFLLFHKPSGYTPNTQVTGQGPRQEIADYWTYLGSEIYNNAQLKKPFDVIIDQNRVNEAILKGKWPQESESVKLYAPTAQFNTNEIKLLSTAEVSGAEVVLTIELDPLVDPNGMGSILIKAVRVGAMNVTLVAKMLARKAYKDQIKYAVSNPNSMEGKLLASLLDSQSFEPIFTVKNMSGRRATVQVEAVQVEENQIRARLVPVQRR